jgi:hypothetical protein
MGVIMNKIDVDEVVSGIYFVELHEDQNLENWFNIKKIIKKGLSWIDMHK